MFSLKQTFIVSLLLTISLAIRFENTFITFNTSSRGNSVSTSIATNTKQQFSLYYPLLISNPQSTVRFVPGEHSNKIVIKPEFTQPEDVLYNELTDGEYWYGFKKGFHHIEKDTTAVFAFSKIEIGNQNYNLINPLFSLPLTFLDFNNLYRCDNVLISYRKTEHLADVTIFSERQSWHLFPQAVWGFRNKDDTIHFSRQTYPLGTNIEIDVGTQNYCNLHDNLQKKNVQIKDPQEIYSLNDLLEKYSTRLQLLQKVPERQSSEEL